MEFTHLEGVEKYSTFDMVLYECDRLKNTECKGRDRCFYDSCRCHLTSDVKFAKHDRSGKPIVTIIIDSEGKWHE